MSDDINLEGVIVKPKRGLQALVRWLGYGLCVVGFLWVLVVSVASSYNVLEAVWRSVSIELLLCWMSGALLLMLSAALTLLSEIRDANHTIVD